MRAFHLVSGADKTLAYVFGNHNGPVMSTRAAKGDGEITLPFLDVMRQKINQQLRDAIQKFLGLRKGTDVASHGGVLASVRLEFGTNELNNQFKRDLPGPSPLRGRLGGGVPTPAWTLGPKRSWASLPLPQPLPFRERPGEGWFALTIGRYTPTQPSPSKGRASSARGQGRA